MIGSKSFTCWTILSLCVGLISGTAVDQYGGYGTGVSSSTTQRSNSELRCMDINPQNSVDLEQVKYNNNQIYLSSQSRAKK